MIMVYALSADWIYVSTYFVPTRYTNVNLFAPHMLAKNERPAKLQTKRYIKKV